MDAPSRTVWHLAMLAEMSTQQLRQICCEMLFMAASTRRRLNLIVSHGCVS